MEPLAPSLLLQQLLEQRRSWVELEPGKRVRITRPPEADVVRRFLRPSATEGGKFAVAITDEDASQYVVGWEGFTEADVLGQGVGGSSQAAFSLDLWRAVSADRYDWLRTVTKGVLDAVIAFQEKRAVDAKN